MQVCLLEEKVGGSGSRITDPDQRGEITIECNSFDISKEFWKNTQERKEARNQKNGDAVRVAVFLGR